MPVTPLDLVAGTAKPLQVTFDNDAVLNLTYQPGKYTADVERIVASNQALGRETIALAYGIATLVDEWDLEFAEGESVTGYVKMPAGETVATVEHELGFKPSVKKMQMERRRQVIEPSEYVKKITAETFDVVFPEPPEEAETVFWTIDGLAGKPIPLKEQHVKRLPLPVLQRSWQHLLSDLFPNQRRAFNRS